MKRRSWKPVVGMLVWLPMMAVLVWMGSEQLSYRPGVDPEKALIDRAMLPSRLGDAAELQDIDWQEDGNSRLYGSDERAAANWMANESWTNGGDFMDSPQLTQSVFRYSIATSAMFNLHRVRPASAYDDDQLTALVQTSQPVPVNIGYRSPHADEQRVVCAIGGADACQVWYVWQRSGQYIVQTRLLSLDQPLPASALVPVVATIDTSVAATLAAVVDEYPSPRSFATNMIFTIMFSIVGLTGLLAVNDERMGVFWFGKWWHGHFPRGKRRALLSNRAQAIGWLLIGLTGVSASLLNKLPFPRWLDWTIFGGLALASIAATIVAAFWMSQAIDVPRNQRTSPQPSKPVGST